MQVGSERRRYKRLPIELQLEVNKVFKQGYIVLDDLATDISVFDISKLGIGFMCKAELPLDYYFDGKIKLHQDTYFYAVVHILRVRKGEDGSYVYGAEFVGLAPFLADKIDLYEKTLEKDEDQ